MSGEFYLSEPRPSSCEAPLCLSKFKDHTGFALDLGAQQSEVMWVRLLFSIRSPVTRGQCVTIYITFFKGE